MKAISALATTAILFAATPAVAASDYLLQLPAVDGEAATTIEVESWSWGTVTPSATESSNLNMSKSNSARLAQPAAADGTLAIKSPRDVATGQASGKRAHCPKGTHFPKATLVLRRETWNLSDVVIGSCDAGQLALTYQKIEIGSAEKAAGPGSGKSTKTRSNIQNN